MTAIQGALTERVRALIADEPVTREVSMFGGRSIMVNDRMIVSALRNGSLLVRVDADRHEELLGRPGATQAEMGAGRVMGPGWIEVDGAALIDDAELAAWVGTAMEHNRAVTARPEAPGAPAASERCSR